MSAASPLRQCYTAAAFLRDFPAPFRLVPDDLVQVIETHPDGRMAVHGVRPIAHRPSPIFHP